jgi:hypothetical protein
MSRDVALDDYFRKYLERYADMRAISLHTAEGTSLCTGPPPPLLPFCLTLRLFFSVNRPDWEGGASSNLVPSFTVSFDQVPCFLSLSVSSLFLTVLWK